ncbi:MFS transporter [Salinibaculum salinum]|uniref:MFS transporter n=1 Tax=Salinibaculum salinum TaxID=3131996 RepID=UPI0030EBF7B7
MSGDVRRFVAVVTAWQIVASSCYYAVFAAAPFVRETFGLSRFLVGVVVTTMTLGYTLFLFPSGAAVDAYGERPMLVGGLAALGAGAVAVAIAPSVAVLFVAAFALGSAYASAMPAGNRAIVVGVPSDVRGVALGLKQVGVTVGSGLSAVVVVTLAPMVATWTAGLVALGASAVVVAGLFAAGYPAHPGDGRLTTPDIAGLRANGPYVALVLAGFFLGAALFTTVGYLTLYLTESVGVAASLAGIGFVLLQVTASVGRVVIGDLADRLERRTDWGRARSAATLLTGQVAIGAVLLGGFALPVSTAVAFVLVAGIGLTVLGFPGLYYTCMSALVDDSEVGAATAGGQTTLNAGALVAPPAFGWLADTLSYRASWGLLTGSAIVGVALVGVVVWRTRNGPEA